MIVGTARDAAELLAPLFALASAEKLAVIHLDGERRVIGVEESAVASAEAVELPIREIVGAALRLGSAGLVIGHNHPSGDPRPSSADIEATRRLAQTAANLGIMLHDHLVFAGGACRSFRELGLL
ncbi:MAG TPA: JAB domain-containing protein [Allosphingosinicella sp.]|jgi:DNA repair protein RadC